MGIREDREDLNEWKNTNTFSRATREPNNDDLQALECGMYTYDIHVLNTGKKRIETLQDASNNIKHIRELFNFSRKLKNDIIEKIEQITKS